MVRGMMGWRIGGGRIGNGVGMETEIEGRIGVRMEKQKKRKEKLDVGGVFGNGKNLSLTK